MLIKTITSPAKQITYAKVARSSFQRTEDWEDNENADSEQEGDNSYSKEGDNPYNHNLDIEVGEHMSHEDLKSTLANLPKAPKKPKLGMRTETLVVDKKVITNCLMHLQQRGVILYTIDFNPSRDLFESQAYTQIGEKLNIKIEQIRVITRFTFLIVVFDKADQKKLLIEQFLKMEN